MPKLAKCCTLVFFNKVQQTYADSCMWWCRDDVNHKGEKLDWGQWAITGNDPDFGGTGNPDTGDDYGPAPGRILRFPASKLAAGISHMRQALAEAAVSFRCS